MQAWILSLALAPFVASAAQSPAVVDSTSSGAPTLSAAPPPPVQWPASAGGNEHYYEVVHCCAPPFLWSDAQQFASARSYQGLQGYLATITSSAENAFLVSQFQVSSSNAGLWIGGSDQAVEGEWRWVTGPEAALAPSNQFYQGSSTTGGYATPPFLYENWGQGEPNDWFSSATGEDFAVWSEGHWNLVVGPGEWGDDSNGINGAVSGYIVEYGGLCLPSVSYCTAGTSTNGCAGSMSAAGVPSASSASGFVLTASAIEGDRTGLILYGVSGAIATPWGTGSSFLCVKSPIQRTVAANSGGAAGQCDGALSIDWLAYVASHSSALGTPLTAGASVNSQCWFRDPPAPKSTNLTNGLEFTLCP
jgi:hypothetical protein